MTEDEMVGWHHRKDMRLSKIREIAKPGVLQSLGSQRVRQDRATEQQQPCQAVMRIKSQNVLSKAQLCNAGDPSLIPALPAMQETQV